MAQRGIAVCGALSNDSRACKQPTARQKYFPSVVGVIPGTWLGLSQKEARKTNTLAPHINHAAGKSAMGFFNKLKMPILALVATGVA